MNFQSGVGEWVRACMGTTIAYSKAERAMRVMEEATELCQAGGLTEAQALAIVRSVYAKPVGEVYQELGGNLVTLAAFATAHGLSMEEAGRDELRRCWQNIDRIREKHRAKTLRTQHEPPKGS